MVTYPASPCCLKETCFSGKNSYESIFISPFVGSTISSATRKLPPKAEGLPAGPFLSKVKKKGMSSCNLGLILYAEGVMHYLPFACNPFDTIPPRKNQKNENENGQIYDRDSNFQLKQRKSSRMKIMIQID